ncbi:hypothetical protein GR254_24665, partial [Mycobacterium tuberculosis]|nr:hypothetical protein [Mycobacterium tuberculosis]
MSSASLLARCCDEATTLRWAARPFERKQYVEKFTELADGVVEPVEQQRFLAVVESLADLESGAVGGL